MASTEFNHDPRYPMRMPQWLAEVRKLKYCTRCGEAGPVEAAHYCGTFAHLFGKGGSQKCSDHLVAALCRPCHTHLDQYVDGNDSERSVEFFLCIARTYYGLIESGRIILRRDGISV